MGNRDKKKHKTRGYVAGAKVRLNGRIYSFSVASHKGGKRHKIPLGEGGGGVGNSHPGLGQVQSIESAPKKHKAADNQENGLF